MVDIPKKKSCTDENCTNMLMEQHLSHNRRKMHFIAVHLGAGEHSLKKKEVYKKLCEEACENALAILRRGGSAGDAVTEATKVLEDSGLINCGSGSNLSIEKTVECDSGYMDGDGYFGGVGAMPGVKNPILVAKQLAQVHKQQKLLSCGRVPPTFLAGGAAKNWAFAQGIPVCDDSDLISTRSKKLFDKFMKQLKSVGNTVNDTAGAIALDNEGHVASTVSSGGNWMKVPGRIGHAPLYGCGCWSSNVSPSTNNNAIAVSLSGAGEMLSRIRLPQECAHEASKNDGACLVDVIKDCIYKQLFDNSSLTIHSEPRYAGLIALLWDGKHGEFSWGHTSKNFVLAYASSKNRSVKMNFSELSDNAVPGLALNVQGILI